MKKILFILVVISILAFSGYNYSYAYLEDYVSLNITKFEVIDKIYLVVGDSMKILVDIEEEENKEVKLTFASSDESVLSVKNDIITGVSDGKVTLLVKAQNGDSREISVVVTSLITLPTLNNDKEYITCGEYSKEENDLLDELLELRINEAGYKTRAGALAAMRFLLLEFRSGIKYYNENGRLENHSNILHIDGEGRYYHKGLYLSEEKYSEISASTSDGPKMWGCTLKNINYSAVKENGLNCSGLITWALYNAGYDIKDVGAGDYSYINNELLDLRPKESIDMELLNSGKVKVGDLIGFDGHIAMIIGLEDNIVYVGESYETGLRVRTFTYKELIESDFTDIILMDNYYKEDGKITNMW